MANPATPPYASASLYVGELSPDVTEAMLYDLFKQVGPVASIRVCRDAITRRSLGYAYVNYHNATDAERSLDTLNYAKIAGNTCRIMWSHRDPSRRKSGLGNVFIKNLDKGIDHQNLYDTFSDFGNILSCKVELDENFQSKGYGYVHYETEEEALRSIEKVNGMMLAGKVVNVGRFKPKKERERELQDNFTNVFVKNLPDSVTEEEFKTLFSAFGEIQNAVIMRGSDRLTQEQMDLIDGSKTAEETEAEIKELEEKTSNLDMDASEKAESEDKSSDDSSKGFGFVNFSTTDAAQQAVEGMNGVEVHGKTLYCSRAQKKSERLNELKQLWEQRKMENLQKYQGVNLYVKNLDDTITDEILRKEFQHCGNITSTKVMRDEKAASKGFGFVCFSTPEEATKAVTEMNGNMLNNKPIYVALAQRKEVRRAQLEAQHQQRVSSGMRMNQPNGMASPMYGPNGPVFYPQGGVPQQRVMYQPGMGGMPGGGRPGGWNHRQQGQVRQQGPYQQPMPGYVVNPNVPQRQGGRNGQNRGRPGAGQQNQSGRGRQAGNNNNKNFKYTPAARNQFQQGQMQQQMVMGQPGLPSAAEMAAASPEDTKQLLGERLYHAVSKTHKERAGKITGMFLDSMDNSDLILLLDDNTQLTAKINEAIRVLKEHEESESVEAEANPTTETATEAEETSAPEATSN